MRSDDFKKLNNEFEPGTFTLSSEFNKKATMFILSDGVFINGEVTEYGDRVTDHHELMREVDCSGLIIVDPERETLIVQDPKITDEQSKALLQVPEYFEVMFESFLAGGA